MAETFDYAEAAADAVAMVAEFGATGAIRRTTNSGDAWNPTQTTTDYDAVMAIVEYTNRDIDGTRIRATDRRVLVSTSGLSITPTTADKVITADGDGLSIVNVNIVKPATTVVLYDIQARA